jgi:hypothetical protein
MVLTSYGSFQRSCHHYIPAHPLPDVVQQALDICTPPPSPSTTIAVCHVACRWYEGMAGTETREKVAVVAEEEKHEESGNETKKRLLRQQIRRPFLLQLLQL